MTAEGYASRRAASNRGTSWCLAPVVSAGGTSWSRAPDASVRAAPGAWHRTCLLPPCLRTVARRALTLRAAGRSRRRPRSAAPARATARSPARAAAARSPFRSSPRAHSRLLLQIVDQEQPVAGLRRRLLQVGVLDDLRRHARAGDDVAHRGVGVVPEAVGALGA